MKFLISTISNFAVLYLEYLITILAFLIPFFVSGPQILTGSIVNCFLYLYSATTSKNKLLIVTLPSLGAVLNGVVFGKFTIFLLYFLPLIWIGNYIMMAVFSKYKNQKVFAVTFASILKSLILFLTANIYFSLHFVPKLFLTSMGAVQLITAIIGGLSAVLILNSINKNERFSNPN